jgi:hypothetical protein
LNLDLLAGGGMKEGFEFWCFCSRGWLGPSGPLVMRRPYVCEIAQKILFAKWIAA